MKHDISNPHDKLFKQILGEPENAASFLAGNLPGEILSHLDLNTLQVLQVSFIDAQFIQSEAKKSIAEFGIRISETRALSNSPKRLKLSGQER